MMKKTPAFHALFCFLTMLNLISQSTPIIFFTQVTPKPESYQQAKEEIAVFISKTLQEPGCKLLVMYEPDDKKDGSLYLHEVFENQEALDTHFAQEHTKEILKSSENWLAKPIEIKKLSKAIQQINKSE